MKLTAGKKRRDGRLDGIRSGIRPGISALAFALIVCLFLKGSSSFYGKTCLEGEKTLKRAIARASVQCYAIEGRYPPDVEYLETYYGIQIDRERYHVFYEGFASNIMPDITVIPAGD